MSMESSTSRVPKRNFDGLFVHALKPTGHFAQSLLAIGYDPQAEHEHYPLTVWRAALRVAREHAFPELTAEQANRVLGHRYVEGFAQTLVGRIFASAAPLLGTERCLSRIPNYLRAGREDVRMLLDVVREREWRVMVEDVDPLPDFVAGVLEAVLLLTRAEPRVDIIDRTEFRYTLRIRW
jgi:uncharacterized protein (TIGR02265 family)